MSDKLRKHFERVANTESGVEVFKWLMQYCGYQQPMRVLNPQTHEVNLVTTANNAVLRDIWIETRQMLPVESLILIEHDKQVAPMQAVGDLNNDGRTGSSSSASDINGAGSTGDGKRHSRRDIQRESDNYTRNYLAGLSNES